ncbi:unnamed protein product [Nippostrongylus brasiliensis]|uniref:SCP domain-containing protein n=1 Tax=Nippostrongylus brasiliensis TaxID=27835 RepID=A0A158R196_NIPBR|nr:unnamed protein product [Nippostrongylus brasiliensis]
MIEYKLARRHGQHQAIMMSSLMLAALAAVSIYDCDLEQMATVLASGCPGKAPSLRRAITFSRFNDDAKTIEDAIKEGTDTFFPKQVKWPKKNILPDVTVDYYPFVTMVNANATAVGCYKEACDNSGTGAGTTVVCFYDVPSRLAGGNIAKANGNRFPTAANMRKLKYDCTLEVQARNYATQCTNTGIGDIQIEDFAQINSAQNDMDAIDQAIRYWWKQGTLVNGIGVQQVMFKEKHKNSTVRFFTLLGWATMERIGCGVFKCNNVFNVACRFTPGLSSTDYDGYQKDLMMSPIWEQSEFPSADAKKLVNHELRQHSSKEDIGDVTSGHGYTQRITRAEVDCGLQQIPRISVNSWGSMTRRTVQMSSKMAPPAAIQLRGNEKGGEDNG